MKNLTLLALLFIPVISFAVSATPSTNTDNEVNGWAHYEVTNTTPKTVEVEFTSTRGFASCFEYRSDGDISQSTGVNYNVAFTDLYPYVCVNNSTSSVTIDAKEYVEIRMVFGAESDERFDWERVPVAEIGGGGACYSMTVDGCKRNWYLEETYTGKYVPVESNMTALQEQYIELLKEYVALLEAMA